MSVVAVASYGEKYLPMLLSFLETWGSRFPEIYVCVGGVSDTVVEELRAAYPNVEIITSDARVAWRESVRISQKMEFWKALADRLHNEAREFAIFADADTVLVGDLGGFCDADVVLTTRGPQSRYILNTGIVGLSYRALQADFMSEWLSQTNEIILDPAKLNIATSPDEIYGGGDQMAMIQMLSLDQRRGDFCFRNLHVRTVPCDEYNACENIIDPERAKVLHLKASLHKFLLERQPLIGERRMEDSMVQLQAALNANRSAVEKMALAGVPSKRIKRLYRFRPPRGMRRDLSVPRAVMLFYRSRAYMRRAAGALLRRIAKSAKPSYLSTNSG